MWPEITFLEILNLNHDFEIRYFLIRKYIFQGRGKCDNVTIQPNHFTDFGFRSQAKKKRKKKKNEHSEFGHAAKTLSELTLNDPKFNYVMQSQVCIYQRFYNGIQHGSTNQMLETI